MTEHLGGQLSSKRNFPWKTFPAELIRLGMVIKGYPEDVLLPGEFHTTANKGIANLTLKETRIFVAALKAGTMRIKKVSEASHTSPTPLPDDHDSGDNDSDTNPSTVRPILKPPPSREFKVVRPPKSQKKDEKKIIKKNLKEVVSPMSSNLSNPRSDSEQPDDDDGVKNDSDYENDSAPSKKRKAKSEVTSRASKKRTPPSEASLPKIGHSKSMKGKGKVHAEKRKQPFAIESSDEEEAPDMPVRVIQTAKRLHDGPTAQEVPKASMGPNDADATARGSVEAPVRTKPAAAAGQSTTVRVTREAPAGNTGHADSVPAHSLPPSSPSQNHQQAHSLPENSIHTNTATLAMKQGNNAVRIEPATHVASNTSCTDPVHADPTTRAASQDNTMLADPIRTDRPPSLQPDLLPTLAAHHRRSEPAMEVPRSHHERRTEPELPATSTDGDFNAENHTMMRVHDPEVRPMYDPCQRGPILPRYGPGFTQYPQSDYYHDPRTMPHAPQLPHAPQPRSHQPSHAPL
ncbi:hypothetical protein DFJ58DRAFT_841014 [Suillus subalutaceus]|uniref:uncharacterized protein n=1 Tax=Suillus subalutaceus TaxID=48586 RepID=UPI001B87D243|nr:uncharacterized protein DFJ58DRAFT_841014 [Suillus subalutaceus]KAG1855716.1 hypothetical protein DFJ58DRAFT_841014 [Suillus subalutaceus]